MRYKIYILVIALLLSLTTISATIELGNLSHSIHDSYTKMTPLRGWVNFSVTNEPSNTIISAFDSKITLIELMDENNIACNIVNPYECTCFPSDCQPAFSTFNEPSETKTYTLGSIDTKLFGIELNENVSEITNFRFNISTNADSSCTIPLMIDLFDDGTIEYKSYNVSDEECLIDEPFGCFKLSDKVGAAPINATELCQRITLPPLKGFKIGANIIGEPQSASFTMKFGGVLEEECTIEATSAGQVSCKLVLSTALTETTQVEVCISANEGSEEKYSINFEKNNSCGFVNDADKEPHDFEIFAKPLKYAPVPEIAFDDNLFEEETNVALNIFDYINRRYGAKCDDGCVIPLRIYSGISQSVTLSKLIVDYNVGGLNTPDSNQTNFTDINSTPALFTSAFIKYDLDSVDLLTPSDTNITELELEIGDKSINQNISIIKIPSILRIISTKAATLVPTRFFAIISETGNLTYDWDFGDNSLSQTTRTNVIEHTYSALGTYFLTLNITNEQGTISKIISVNVVAPFQAINETIVDYRARLRAIDNNLLVLSDKIQERVTNVLDTADLKSAINRIEGQYKELFETDSEELVKLMKQLTELNVPVSFGTSLEIKPSPFIQSSSRLDVDIMGEFGGGNVEQDKIDRYPSAINQWIEESIDITMESKSYSFHFIDGTEQTALSHIILKLKPKKTISEFYIIIEGDTNNIKFIGDYSEKEIDENHVGITLRDLEPSIETKIEFIHPEKVEFLNPPISLSPEFKFLELGFIPGVCNNNGVCDSKENYTNCRADCKPITRTIIFLVLLFLFAFIIYIVMQEWYKRNYQKRLFKKSNELFNLINFMSNGKNQKLSKEQIFKQLKSRKWSNEQLNYAWQKLHNKRTGMYEIPILRPFEKRKLKKELEKRKAMGLK